MNLVFGNKELQELFYHGQYSHKSYSAEIIKKYIKAINFIQSAVDIRDFQNFTSYHFEKLVGAHQGKYSVRLNIQRRLIFSIGKIGTVYTVTIEAISKHYE